MSYAGDLTVRECWDLLGKDNNAYIIDVRTTAEWAFVGLPDLEQGMKEIILQPWQNFPDMMIDSDFAGRLREQLSRAGANAESKLCFLCRSGGRSLAAAQTMAAAGYANSFNIAGGFEGDLDEQGHRGHRNGWKADGLPWRQR